SSIGMVVAEGKEAAKVDLQARDLPAERLRVADPAESEGSCPRKRPRLGGDALEGPPLDRASGNTEARDAREAVAKAGLEDPEHARLDLVAAGDRDQVRPAERIERLAQQAC